MAAEKIRNNVAPSDVSFDIFASLVLQGRVGCLTAVGNPYQGSLLRKQQSHYLNPSLSELRASYSPQHEFYL